MTIVLEPYQLFMMAVAVIGALVGMIKLLGNQIKANIDQHFLTTNLKIEEVARQATKTQEETRQLERQFLEFKADMPFRYIARDDYIRGQTVIEAKLDAVAAKLEKVQLQQRVQP
jgi:septal ring factor EnvC (AmiA/AmiB activator)